VPDTSDATPGAIETERLLLRPFTLDDRAAYGRLRDQPEIQRWLPRTAESTDALADRIVRQFVQCWAAHGYGPWTVIEKESGRLIGHHGLRYLPEFGETEILYALDPSVWRRGYAAEAGRAALRFAFETVGLDRVMAITLHDNVASRGVMERLGLRYEKDAVFKGTPVVYYALDRADWTG